jgi:hypothetical protein
MGDPAGSNATTGLALGVTGTHKPLHHDKVEIPSGGWKVYVYFFCVFIDCYSYVIS